MTSGADFCLGFEHVNFCDTACIHNSTAVQDFYLGIETLCLLLTEDAVHDFMQLAAESRASKRGTIKLYCLMHKF